MVHKKYLLPGIAACILILLINSGLAKIAISGLFFLETGRLMDFSDSIDETSPTEPSATESFQAPSDPPVAQTFSVSDLDLLSVQYLCGYRPNLESLLTQPLNWELKGDSPTVLIVHTHATEGYDGTENYRTLDETRNMVSIGDEIARILEEGGICVLHDRTFHDYPDYDSSYSNARRTIEGYLAQYPSIQMVLDIHRDASDSTAGQLVTSATVGGQRSAQLMMVIGTDESGNHHPGWEENLSLGLKLSAVLEQENPGICRPIALRAQRFNMDLTPGSLLIEVGAAGNTHEEAMIAANALAYGILQLADGANLGSS